MTQSTVVRWSSPKTILVATNMVEDHTFILHAIYQAALSRAKVLLVHVIPPSYLRAEAAYGTPFFVSSIAVRNARAKLDEMAAEFQRQGLECEPILLDGHPEEQIPAFLKSHIVDRVIVAARNASGVERLMGGSVAEALISAVEVPVCTIGHHLRLASAGTTPPERILLATTLTAESPMLANFASSLAELYESHLTLLYVLDTAGMTEQEGELARFKARQRLSGLIPTSAKHQHQPVYLIPVGDPAKVIPHAAGSMLQDLVILGGPYPSLISWILGTSLVHRVILEAQCPVITIKSPGTRARERQFLYNAIDADATLVASKENFEEATSSR
jgi:nucleotide-binding universal stress UspA family protein